MPDRASRRGWGRPWVVLLLLGAAGGLILIALARMSAGGHTAMFTDVATPEIADAKAFSEAACWGDVDGDDDQDLLVVNGGDPLRLWQNQGSARFVDIAPRVLDIAAIGVAAACSLVDLDDDGDLDLYIVEHEPKSHDLLGKLFQNDGAVLGGVFGAVFTDITVPSGALMRRSGGASVDWGDMDGDSDLDGFVAGRYGRQRTRTNALFEQVAPLQFRDIAPAKALADTEGPQNLFLGSWFDYDADGDLDLLMAVDFWGVELYRHDGKTFRRVTTTALPRATDDTPGAPPNNPMGVTWGDYDNDGCWDVFVTGTNILGQGGFDARHLTDLASRLYRGDCRGRFTDVTVEAGFWPTGHVEWAANFIDYDNDGDLDLSIVAGHVTDAGSVSWAEEIAAKIIKYPRRLIPPRVAAWLYRYEAMIPAIGNSGPEAAMPKILYRNQLVETGKATFVEVTYAVGVGDVGAARGSAWADMDADGDLDWFTPNRKTPNRLFRNDGPVGNYLRVHVIGARHRQAIGAWVRIQIDGQEQLRHVHVLDGYLSQSQLDPHFGLGMATTVDELWVRWPNTTAWVRMCAAIPANRTVVVTQGVGCRW